jgi:hypothetical protein
LIAPSIEQDGVTVGVGVAAGCVAFIVIPFEALMAVPPTPQESETWDFIAPATVGRPEILKVQDPGLQSGQFIAALGLL